jgi:predicted PurR-regulated permease PerM
MCGDEPLKMAKASETSRSPRPRKLSRAEGKQLVILAVTAACLYLCYRLLEPFVPALVWAVTAAVIAQPLVVRLRRQFASRQSRASIALAVVTAVVFMPISAVIFILAVQIGQAFQNWESYWSEWQAALDSHPRVAAAWDWLAQRLDLAAVFEQVAGTVHDGAMAIASISLQSLIQVLITLFVLFYLFRDQQSVFAAVRQLSPLNETQTNRLLKKLGDTIHATVFGTVMVAILQGALGGFIFWVLGIPGAVLWGTVMAALAIIPYLGAFVIWAPAALLLAAQGDWWRAAVLAAWGTIVVSLIDNLIYPILVGNRLRQHTVVAFFAIVGGVALFGAPGLILGPVVVSLTEFMLEFWRANRRLTE